MSRLELLAPAGSYESFLAAVQNGADAVYLGGTSFGARAFADNFDEAKLTEVISYAHLRGVKVYVTVNTIIFDQEWDELSSYLAFLYQSGCDALIVQDLGVLKFIKEKYPDLYINGSTQLNIHNVEGAELLRKLGVKRIVLGREVPLETVRKIHETVDIELEVFAHGALCFSYSGNCLMSSFIGKRSGNRGRCAQPCRLPYQLKRDGQLVNDTAYLLSTKDLLTLDHLPEIIESGVTSIKIEGRMKKPEYVASVVRAYRQAIDRYYDHRDYRMTDETLHNLKKVFNREFTKGYLFNETNTGITNINTPNHQGVEIGRVVRRTDDQLFIRLVDDLNLGDGIRVKGNNEMGFNVTKMFVNNQDVPEASAGSTVMINVSNEVRVNDAVLKTSDIRLAKELAETITSNQRKVGISGKFTAFIGRVPELILTTRGCEVIASGDEAVQRAEKAPMGADRIEKQLSKLGDTPFVFEHLEINISPAVFINIADLNEVRRRATTQLSDKLSAQVERKVVPMTIPIIPLPEEAVASKAEIVAFVDNQNALDAAREAGCREIICQGRYRELPEGVTVAFNRIVPAYPKSLPKKALVNEPGGLLIKTRVIAGPYCNLVNTRAFSLLSDFGIREAYLSLEMSRNQIRDVLETFRKDHPGMMTFGMLVYGRIDMMISKHCLIAKNLQLNHKQCQMCHEHRYELIDRLGNYLPLVGDSDCNLRILNPKRLNLIDYVPEIRDMGISKIGLVFTTESHDEIISVIRAYQSILNGEKVFLKDADDTYGHYLKGIE